MIYLKRRGLSCLLIAILLLSYTTVAFAGSIDEKQKELDGIKGNIKNTRGQIENVKGEQGDVSTQLANLEEDLKENKIQLEKVEKELKETKENIEATKKELQEAIEKAKVHKELMEERLCAMYMCSNTSYLEVIFEAKSFTDFLDRVVMVREIVSLDQQVLKEMQALKDEIEEKKEQLEEQEIAVENKKAEIVRKKETIERQQKEREALLAELKQQEQELEQNLAQLEKDSKDVEDAIKRYMAEQAEKERKRKEQERKQKEQERLERKKQQRQTTTTNRGGNSGSGQTDSGSSGGGSPLPQDPAPKYTGGSMTWPVPGYYSITSPYGYRIHPISGTRKFHSGIDIAGGGINGKNAVAAASGTVISAGTRGGYGNCVIIDHGGGISTLYAHGSSILVSPGQSVRQGQPVLKVGSTGASTGPHLHFEVRKNGSPVNPMNYLR